MKRSLSYVMLLFFFLFLAMNYSCESEQEKPEGPAAISDISHSDCKNLKSSLFSKEDCFKYETKDGYYLKISRINIAFNCCIDGVLVFVSENQHNEITIKETEICTTPCNCNCLYDLEYTLGPLDYGTYTFHVIEQYADTMTFSIVFSATTSGANCEVRNTYPWN